jgi:hypothetical protein
MRTKFAIECGKFCRGGINCRARLTMPAALRRAIVGVFAMARRLLIPSREI